MSRSEFQFLQMVGRCWNFFYVWLYSHHRQRERSSCNVLPYHIYLYRKQKIMTVRNLRIQKGPHFPSTTRMKRQWKFSQRKASKRRLEALTIGFSAPRQPWFAAIIRKRKT